MIVCPPAEGRAEMLQKYVKKILSSRVYDVALETPLTHAPGLSSRLRNQVLFKREDLQPVFSFKIRGAYNRIAQLSEAERDAGVITASAGNHAQGVALAAQALGLRATVVMGVNTPDIKIEAVRRRGARVVLQGDTYDDAARHAHELEREHGMTYVHAYDDIDVIAGQGTIGMEILNQHGGALDAIFVPVGGGGLIAGIGAYVKYLRSDVKVIGVEAEGSACMAAAMRAGRRVRLRDEDLDLFADGVSVAQVGKEPFRIARRCVDTVLTVNSDEICAAIKDVFDDTRAIAEPAGALATAGMKKWVEAEGVTGKTLIAIISGANVNFDRLRHISERAEIGEQREVILAVTIDERPGSFRRFCRALGKRSITEFNYRYADPEHAQVFVGLQVSTPQDRSAVIDRLRARGYSVEDMTDNEMAKLHVRHMVGGRARALADERLFRFEFPERPGALITFLSGLGQRWNITMFHYRNHGAAWGRVLAGIQVPVDEQGEVRGYLDRIGYRYWEETGNAAYERFLR